VVKAIIVLQVRPILTHINVQLVLIHTSLIEHLQLEELLLVFNVQQGFIVRKEAFSQLVCVLKVIIALQEQRLNMNSLVQLEPMLISLVLKPRQNASHAILETTALLEVHTQPNVLLEPTDQPLELKQQMELQDVLLVLLAKFVTN